VPNNGSSSSSSMAMMTNPVMGMTTIASAAAGTAGNNPKPNPTSFNMAMFETAASPNSTSDAPTPQTMASSSTMANSAADATATSFKTDEFTPFGGFGGSTAGNGFSAHTARGGGGGFMDFPFDPTEAAFAAGVELSSFEDNGGWDDVGEI
jgi:hypothetical protein